MDLQSGRACNCMDVKCLVEALWFIEVFLSS